VATGQGTAEVGKAYKANGGKARASRERRLVGELYHQSVRLASHGAGANDQSYRCPHVDFSGLRHTVRPENPVPRVNEKGVVARDGTLKESNYVFQKLLADSDDPLLWA